MLAKNNNPRVPKISDIRSSWETVNPLIQERFYFGLDSLSRIESLSYEIDGIVLERYVEEE